MSKLLYKILPITECKAHVEGGVLFLEGYANTKGVADRYGDVPAVYSAKRNFVYDLSEYQKNPVLLIDHVNKVDHIAGSMEFIKEDEKGLRFKARFSNSTHENIAHCRAVYSEGHAKGISIAGQFFHEDEKNPDNLTLAKIFEISCVPVPADPNALAAAVSKAIKDFAATTAAPAAAAGTEVPADEKQQKIFTLLALLDKGETLAADDLRVIMPYLDEMRRKAFGTNEYMDPAAALQRVEAAENEIKENTK